MIICKTPFRISFFGGGTDWPEFFEQYGGAVLGSAIDSSIYHSVSHFRSGLFDYSVRLAYRKVECVQSVHDIEHRPFREILQAFGITKDIEINLAADLPTFSGLGSSSSFTVGLINALSSYQGQYIPRHELAYRAIEMERQQLGEAVGCQDQVFAAFGGFNLVEFYRRDHIVVNRLVVRQERMEELNRSLLLFFTGVTRKAHEIEKNKIGRIAQTKPTLFKLRNQVDEGHNLLTGDLPLSGFGELLHRAWLDKKQLSTGVTNSHIDQMYQHAREHGSLGGKLLGAGGGGFLLLFVPPERQQRLRRAMDQYYEVPFRLNAPGSTVIHS